jgi:nicotinate phosphoribosyltransferase
LEKTLRPKYKYEKADRIIPSKLDNDFYKYTMGCVVFLHMPNFTGAYEFTCRCGSLFTQAMVEDILKQLDFYAQLKFHAAEMEWLENLNLFPIDYLEYLYDNAGKPKYWSIGLEGGLLSLGFEGKILDRILDEVPVLSIINEVYFNHVGDNDDGVFELGFKRLCDKAALATDALLKFMEFGTRRRRSQAWQEYIFPELMKVPSFLGTSNLYLAMKFGVPVLGTMAHEYIMMGLGFVESGIPIEQTQAHMLKLWLETFSGKLAIALTDTYTTEAFLKDFDSLFAGIYDGVRHDSGDPYIWSGKMIAHYSNLDQFEPALKKKKVVYSDGLDFPLAIHLQQTFGGIFDTSAGIGTNITNDFSDVPALKIVIKLVKVNKMATIKVSDEPMKSMCKDKSQGIKIAKAFGIGGFNTPIEKFSTARADEAENRTLVPFEGSEPKSYNNVNKLILGLKATIIEGINQVFDDRNIDIINSAITYIESTLERGTSSDNLDMLQFKKDFDYTEIRSKI